VRAALLVPASGDPLRRVAGLTLLDRNLRTVRAAGAEDTTLVTPDGELAERGRAGSR